MPNISAEAAVEPKLLGEECWIALDGGGRIRVDYLTRGQRRRFEQLAVQWHYDSAPAGTDHHMGYFIRCAVREVEGFEIDGKPAKVKIEYGMAKSLVAGEAVVDFLDYLDAAGIRTEIEDKVFSRLEFTALDKKKLKSAGSSSGKSGSAASRSRSKRARESSTAGGHSPETVERTS